MAKHVFRVEIPPEGQFIRDGKWFIISSDAVVSRSSTDGKSYETAEVQLLWERANELTQRELDEMEYPKEMPSGWFPKE